MRPFLRVLTATAAIGLLGSLAFAVTGTKVGVTTKHSDSDYTELEIEVFDDIEWQDLHFEPWDVPVENPPRKLGKAPDKITIKDANGNETKLEGTYNAATGSNHYKVKSGETKPKKGKFTVRLDWTAPKGATLDFMQMKVYVTTNGSLTKFGPDDILGGGGTVTGGNYVPGWFVSFRGPSGDDAFAQCSVGSTIPLMAGLDESWAGYRYHVYSARTPDEAGFDDLSLGVNHVTDPVPPEWGISLSGIDGVLDENGQPAAPILCQVPNSAGLVGKNLYVVLALMDPTSLDVVLTTSVLRVKVVE